MTSQVTTKTLTLNTPANLTPPQTAPNIGAVILQNLSPYQLSITYLGNQYALAPYMSDFYPAGVALGAPMTLVPTDPNNNPAGLPAYVTATWYSPDDLPDTTGFPATISPPVVATGIAVAEQLLASGVPVPLQTTFIGNVIVRPVDLSGSHVYDVSAYASLQIVGAAIGSIDWPITVSFGIDPTGATEAVWTDEISTFGVEIPVFAQYVQFYAPLSTVQPANVKFGFWGTNRAVSPAHPVQQNYASSGFGASTANQARVVGTAYPLTVNNGLLFSGPAFLSFQSNGTVVGGEFEAISNDGTTRAIANTGEFFATPNGHKGMFRLAALPANLAGIQFTCTVAGTNTVFCFGTPNW